MARPDVIVELNYGVGDTYVPAVLALDTGRLDINALSPSVTGDWLILDHATRGNLDEERLAASSTSPGFWTNLADFTERVSTRRGRTRALESFDAGRANVVLDNSDRRFDPTNVDGPYVIAGTSAIQPMRPVRVRAVYAGRSYPLFSGYADAWDIEWDDPSMSFTTLTATDAFKVLADFDPLEVSPVGGGEDSGARVNRILDNASFATEARAIDTGESTLQATNLSANALAELKLVADSERGQLYVDAEGKVTFKHRNARNTETTSVERQVLYGDDDSYLLVEAPESYGYGEGPYGGGPYGGTATFVSPTGQVPYADLSISFDDELIRNRANVARVGGTAQVASDGDSIARYLTHTFTRTDLLLETDDEAAQYAAAIVAGYKDGELRFDRLVVEPDGDNTWALALGLDIGHRIAIRRQPPGGGDVIERECFIEGIAHDIPSDGLWRISFDLSDASATTGLVLDHPTRGALDTEANALSY